jgi:protein TonB
VSRTGIPYPRRAKEAGLEGTVSLVLHIGRTGKVLDVSVISSPSPLFNKPVIQTVKKWKFTPAKNSGVAVQVRMKQNVAFKLDR